MALQADAPGAPLNAWRAGRGSAWQRPKSKHGAARKALMQARTGIEPVPAWQVVRG